MIKLNGREVEFKTFPNGETRFNQNASSNDNGVVHYTALVIGRGV